MYRHKFAVAGLKKSDIMKLGEKAGGVPMTEKNKIKTDVILKDFWRQNERFADLFNAVVFQGKEVLKPESLQEMDTDLSGTIRFKDYEESLVRSRDVVSIRSSRLWYIIQNMSGTDPCA